MVVWILGVGSRHCDCFHPRLGCGPSNECQRNPFGRVFGYCDDAHLSPLWRLAPNFPKHISRLSEHRTTSSILTACLPGCMPGCMLAFLSAYLLHPSSSVRILVSRLQKHSSLPPHNMIVLQMMVGSALLLILESFSDEVNSAICPPHPPLFVLETENALCCQTHSEMSFNLSILSIVPMIISSLFG